MSGVVSRVTILYNPPITTHEPPSLNSPMGAGVEATRTTAALLVLASLLTIFPNPATRAKHPTNKTDRNLLHPMDTILETQ